MALPQWLQTTRMGSIVLPPPSPPTFAANAGGSPNYQLPLNMQIQEQTNWCWAAVSTSVAILQSSGSGWTQCKVASQELNLACCDNQVVNQCNAIWYLEKALARVVHLNTWKSGVLGAADIRLELANNHPLGCRIGWFASGGHFVAISGIQGTTSGDDVTVDDPFYGRSVVPLTTFQTNYRSSGSWTHSYYTN